MSKTLIVVLGPTAIGKTSHAIDLAKHFKTEVVSADSRQFYKELQIGTARPLPEELMGVKHHFLASHSIKENYNVSDFEKDALNRLEAIFKSSDFAIMAGGSGLYIDAVCRGFDENLPDPDPETRKKINKLYDKEGLSALQNKLKELDPEFYEEIDLNNPKRLLRAIEVCLVSGKKYSQLRKGEAKNRPFNIIKIGLNTEREKLYENINKRVDQMMEEGLLEEAEIVEKFREHNTLKTVGYRELFRYFDGEWPLEKAIEKIKVNTRRFAKRQITWFKRDESVKWFQPGNLRGIIKYIEENS